MGIPAERISVVPHFVADTRSPWAPAPADGRTVLFIGRLSREKGVHVLLEAWANVKTPQANLLVVGDGPERANLETLAAELNLRNVKFTGFLPPDQQDSVWRSACVSVVPSIWQEPFGMVVFEAWSRGVAPIVSRIGGLQEIVTDSIDGRHVPPDDPRELASVIDDLLLNPEPRQLLARTGTENFDARFSESRWLRTISKLLSDAVTDS